MFPQIPFLLMHYMAWQNESLILPHLMLTNDSIALKSYPIFLPAQAKFYYSLMFVLMPYVFYCIQVVSSHSSKFSPNVLFIPFHIALYPCVQMVRNCFYQLKFLLARGQERTKQERIARKTEPLLICWKFVWNHRSNLCFNGTSFFLQFWTLCSTLNNLSC